MHPLRWSFVVVTLVAVSCGCASSSDSSPTGPDGSGVTTGIARAESGIANDGTGLTRLAAELANIREANDGMLPLADALDLFAAAFGDIPGGDSTRFEGRQGDGTLAIMAVGAHWDELTADQQSSVRVHLGYSNVQSFRAPSVAATVDPIVQSYVDSAQSAIASFLGIDLSFPIVVESIVGLTEEGVAISTLVWAERDGDPVGTGRPDVCRVRFDPRFASATTVAETVFYCFEFELTDVGAVYAAQPWITAGSARWAGAKVGGVDEQVLGSFSDWRDNEGSVFGLDYNAVGFYWVVEAMGVDPWSVIGAMLVASGIEAVAVTGLDPAGVLNRISTSIARSHMDPSLPVSAAWDIGVAGVPEMGYRAEGTVTPTLPMVLEGTRSSFAPVIPHVFTLEGGDRVQVAVEADVGTFEFFGKDPIVWPGQWHQEFCLDEGGCLCGLDGAVDSGLDQGSRNLVVGSGELDASLIRYDLRIPDPGTAFTDGHWEGTLTYTVVGIDTGGTLGTLSQSVGPIDLTVANGAVTAGSFELGIPGEFDSAGGARAVGVYDTVAAFGGCGFSPQVTTNSVGFAGTITTSSGVSIPFNFDFGFDASAGPGTLWRIDTVTDPNRRTGEIDSIADQVVRGATGWTVTDVTWTFDMGLTV